MAMPLRHHLVTYSRNGLFAEKAKDMLAVDVYPEGFIRLQCKIG
jgi:hypothetical protein